MKRIILALLLLAGGADARAQTIIQAGPWGSGHVPVYSGPGSSVPFVIDSGPAGGNGNVNQGVSEMLMVQPATPTGPNGTNWCDYDKNPATTTTGYHYLCLSPNAGGGGAIVFGAGGGASPLPLTAIVNGVTTQIGGGSAGTIAFPAAVAGTTNSGGIPYFSDFVTLSSSGTLAANSIILGGGSGGPPATTTTGAGVVTAIGNDANTTGGLPTVIGSIATNDCLIWGPGIKDGGGGGCGGGGLVVGTSPVTSGSSGFVLYNNAGVLGNLPVTGTPGNVVLSTSPTLVTPNLGTPSAIVLTSATGLPISSGVTGLGTSVAGILGNAANASGGFPALAANPTAGHLLAWSSIGIVDGGATGGITVGSTVISGGSNGNVLYDNSGTVGELPSLPIPVNAQVGTTYTVATPDNSTLVTFSNASAVAVTLPQATGSFGAGFNFCAQNLNTGAVTITPNTSTINGGSTIVLLQNQGVCIVSDGTNYQIQGNWTGQGTANQILTINAAGTGYAWTSAPTVRAVISGVTAPTDGSGACTASSIVGGSSGGKFVTTTGCSANALKLNLATAPNGWACTASDNTTPADLLPQTGFTVSQVTFTGTTVNADVITYQCTGF